MSETTEEVELPRLIQLDTMLGWRRAKLQAVRGWGVGLFSLNKHHSSFGIQLLPEMDARCYKVAPEGLGANGQGGPTPKWQHVESVPWLPCTCGFYALKERHELDARVMSGNVTLEVELSGTIVEAVNGFRAQHQRILSCRLYPSCTYRERLPPHVDGSARASPRCNRVAPVGMVEDQALFMSTNLVARCDQHRPESGLVTLNDIAGSLGVEVTWNEREY